MKNYVQPGDVLTVVAPGGGVTSGVGFFLGDLFVVPTTDASSGENVECLTTGVVELAKATGTGFTAGDSALFDVSADQVDGAASDAADRSCGIVVEDAASGDTTVKVAINKGIASGLQVKGGTYTQTADDASADIATITTGLSVVLGFSVVLVSSADALNGTDAVVAKSGGDITVADGGATYAVTDGHKVHWVAVGY